MSQELVDSVNKLTGETTKLLLEYTDSNTTLKNSAASAKEDASKAAMSESAAATSNTEAKNAELAAKAEADRAELAATQAEQVAGLDTVGQAVAQALADGGYTWRTEADMIAMREQNNAMFAASGFVYMGKHWENVSNGEFAINEGLQTYTKNPNVLYSGIDSSYISSTPGGISGSFNPVVNIAGFVTHLESLNSASLTKSVAYKFPDSEKGTRTYNSETGISIDYAKEVDPKYGDVAPDHNEAVARAFEGVIPNGDFRFGNNGDWLAEGEDSGSITIDSNGIKMSGNTTNANYASTVGVFSSGETYTIEVFAPYVRNASIRIIFDSTGATIVGRIPVSETPQTFKMKFTVPDGLSGARLNFSCDAAQGDYHISHVRVTPEGEEVVTWREDMFGLEGFLEQITPEKPFVYKHGIIQSKAGDIDGIVTSNSNRPNSYYAVFDGDSTSHGHGVNFLALSVIEQDQIANNPKNHIYRMANGDVVQWRIRQRTIAGTNGAWYTTNFAPNSDYPYTLRPSIQVKVMAQGQNDEPFTGKSTSTSNVGNYGGAASPYIGVVGRHKGLWCAYSNSDAGYDGLCFMLVCGVASRLNQGGYHPSLNPMGTSRWWNTTSGGGTSRWYSPKNGWTLDQVKQCFVFGGPNEVGKVCYGAYGASVTASTYPTYVSRPDEKAHDAIYESGAGGITDWRLSAWDASNKEMAAEVFRDIEIGTYRGLEELSWTQVFKVEANAEYSSSVSLARFKPVNHNLCKGAFTNGNVYASSPQVGGYLIVDGKSYPVGQIKLSSKFSAENYAYAIHSQFGGTTLPIITAGTEVYLVVFTTKYDSSDKTSALVSGKFLHTEVTGDPALIFAAPALKNGWMGSWGGMRVVNGNQLSRKSLGGTVIVQYTSNSGDTWGHQEQVINTVENSWEVSFTANEIVVASYNVFARQTERSSLLEVLHGSYGVLPFVWVSSSSMVDSGVLLGESLIGKVASSGGSWAQVGKFGLEQLLISGAGKLQSTSTSVATKHAPITTATVPGSSGVKAIAHQAEDQGKSTLSFVARELRANESGNIGDNESFKPINEVTALTDLNGNVVVETCHALVMPYGWIKNEI